MVNETWKRRRRERGRARRYDPMAEPVQLPAGFVGKIRGALQVAVSDLRTCLSWLDREIGTPMSEVSITLHLNREYGKRGEPDADDIVADVWFDDPHGGRNYQRFTWVYSDERMKDEGGRMKKRGQERMKDEGGRMKRRGRTAEAAGAVRTDGSEPVDPAVLEPCSVDPPVMPEVTLPLVDVAPGPVQIAEDAGEECLSGAAELVVDDGGRVELGADVEVRRTSGELAEPSEVEAGAVPLCGVPLCEAEVRGEPVDVRNPGADADRLAGGSCDLRGSDLHGPSPVPAGCQQGQLVAAGGGRSWRWIVVVALLFGAAVGGWLLSGVFRAALRLEVGRETVSADGKPVPFGGSVETPFEPRSGP